MSESLDLPRQIRKFNPGTFQSDEEVIRQFVVRKPKLGIVMDILRGNVDSPSCQHVLIVAPRGRGKSMLLARVAAEIRSTRDLCEQLLPLRFMEESQEIFDLSDFWLESLFYLARECKERDPELARELEETHTDLTSGWRGEDLEERARATVLEAADRLRKKLVLMVENLQSLCENVDDEFGWKLRGALQSEPQIILVATATSRFKGLDDAREPFFELFRIIRLEPLDTGECRRLWQMVSGDRVTEREIRPLQILTGGNPRLLVVIGEFARHRSLRELMEELVRLIDDHTEYFRGHLEVFAKTERRVYLAVIDLWQPSTTGEIAARARMDVRAVSALLGRLVERGAVLVEGSGRKRMYAAAERLYSIYYKLRRERDEAAVVRNLIHFMAVFYSESELAELSGMLRLEMEESPAIRQGFERAMSERPEMQDSFTNILWPDTGPAPRSPIIIHDKKARLLLGKIMRLVKDGKAQEAIEIVDCVLASKVGGQPEMPESFTAMALLTKGVAHWELGEFRSVIVACDEVIRLFGDNDALQIAVAIALVNKGFAQREINNAEAAIATSIEVVRRFGDSNDLSFQVQVATALVNKGVTRQRFGDPLGAIADYDNLVDRFEGSDAPDLQVQIASALVHKGAAEDKIGETDTAIEICDYVIERFGDSETPELQEQVAMASINKGLTLLRAGEFEVAIAVFGGVIERFEDINTPASHEAIARALVNKGATCEQLGEINRAIEAYDEAISRFGESDFSDVRVQVAEALIKKGEAQIQLGHTEEALHTSTILERRVGVLTRDGDIALDWRAKWIRIKALFVQGNSEASTALIHSIYVAFNPENKTMLSEFLRLIFSFIAVGASEHELVKILASDKEKFEALKPVVIALQQRAGEAIRAPVEMLEVANDIRKRIENAQDTGHRFPISGATN